MPLRVRIVAAFNFAHPPPIQRRRISILLIARHHAAFAADALRHVEVKPVLFAGLGRAQRDQAAGRAIRGGGRAQRRIKQRALQ
jgi:hypothetical protein